MAKNDKAKTQGSIQRAALTAAKQRLKNSLK